MSRRMNEEMFEPRRLRDGAAAPDSVEGRLARQLRSLSAYAPMRQLRRHSALPRRRRYAIAIARLAVAAVVVLAVSSVAAAMAGYVARQVRSSRAVVGQATPPAAAAKPRQRLEAAGRPSVTVAPAQAEVAVPSVAVAVPRAEPLAVAPSPSPGAQAFPAAAAPVPDPRQPARHVALAAPGRHPSAHMPERPLPEAPAAIAPGTSAPYLAETGGLEPPSQQPTAPPQPTSSWVADRSVPGSAPGPAGRAVERPGRDAVTQEAAMLRQALTALRRDHDARGALRLLDAYDGRFGQGALALEATSARAQALLQLGDHGRALELLDRLPLSRDGHTGDLRVTRGELRSVSGRCREALLDFDAVLGPGLGASPATAASEIARALFGRASCRSRLGDSAGAEADRQRYLKEFPQGPAAGRLQPRP